MKKTRKAEQMVTVADLCSQVNDANKKAVIDAYLAGEEHRRFVIAECMKHEVADITDGLKKGVVEPHLRICCCKGTFAGIVAGTSYVNYTGCLPGDCIVVEGDGEDREGEMGDVLVCERVVKRMSNKRLCEYLVHEQECYMCNFGAVHEPDANRQQEYHQTVCKYLLTAAAIAKGIGSSAAEMFMEAYRLLMRRLNGRAGDVELAQSCATGLGISVEQAEAAYDMAERAHGKLWVDLELAKLSPLRVQKVRGKSKKG